MRTFLLAVVSISLFSSVALATPDASDEANRALAEAMAAVGSAKALAPPAPSAVVVREPVRDRAPSSGCSTTPGSKSGWLALALVGLLRRKSR